MIQLRLIGMSQRKWYCRICFGNRWKRVDVYYLCSIVRIIIIIDGMGSTAPTWSTMHTSYYDGD